MSKDKKIILIAILIGIVAMAGMIFFVGKGNVRHVQITWQEKIEQTVSFEDVNGTVQLQGISGIDGEPNPNLVTRINFAYILTVINNGNREHRLYIEGLDLETSLLKPGEQEILKIYPTEKGVYRYYDKSNEMVLLGTLEVLAVIPSDEFTGIFRDLV